MRFRHGAMRGIAAVALLATFLGATNLARADSNASPAAVPDVDVSLAGNDGRLISLDSGTLADAPAGQSIDLGVGDAIWDVVRSGDGSTLATVAFPGGGAATGENVTIVIRDGRTGV